MTETLAETIGRNVRREMESRGVSQQQLGERLGLNQSQVSKRLNGVIDFRATELDKAAAFLGVPPSALIAPAASAA